MRRLTISKQGGTVPHELTEQLVTIGRSPENMIVIDDASVSARHAQLQITGDDYQLSDFDSTNGTRVNDEVITTVVLRPGDRIRFGKVEACFECDAANDTQPLPAPVELEARPAEMSARPADFANASPFPKRRSQRDPIRPVIYAAAGLAILAFIGSMLALAQMHSPVP
ncbi:MAG: FHA domain-containing protein [Chthoniobacterales bacterium]|nr:FHA domain-containing protein [Chthoniobacterales bacterium]